VLVINLKEGEKAFIANQEAAQIIRIGRGNVRLGFDAPGYVRIHRQRVFEAISAENAAEAKSQIPSLEMLTALDRLEELAGKIGMNAAQLLADMIRRFQDDLDSMP